MGIFSRLFGGSDAAPSFTFKPTEQYCIFDAGAPAANGQRNGAPTPRDNFEQLKTFAQFAQQEGLAAAVVLTGRPLREAADGGKYKNVQVFYAQKAEDRREIIAQLIKKHAAAVLVSADAEMLRLAGQNGADGIRMSTFKKIFENRDQRENRRPNGRPPMRSQNGQRPANEANEKADENDAAPSAPATPEAETAPKPATPAPSKEILDLIDPI